jgi:hypothetical protein
LSDKIKGFCMTSTLRAWSQKRRGFLFVLGYLLWLTVPRAAQREHLDRESYIAAMNIPRAAPKTGESIAKQNGAPASADSPMVRMAKPCSEVEVPEEEEVRKECS